MTRLRLFDYGPSANCYKARLLLAHLRREYDRSPVDIFGGDTLTEEFGRINPLRATPVLQVGPDEYLAESNAILVFLAQGTPYLPDDPLLRARVVGWLMYEQTDVMWNLGGLRFRLLTGRLTPEDPDAVGRRTAGEQVLAHLDRHLARERFLVGDAYSIADIAVYAYTHVADEAGHDLERSPHVTAWIARVRSQSGHIDDLEPYPPNARAGAGRSMYD